MGRDSKKRRSSAVSVEDQSKSKKAKARYEEAENNEGVTENNDRKTTKPSSKKSKPRTKKEFLKELQKEEKRKLEVEAIVSHTKFSKGTRKYLIKWKGDRKNTWETSHYVRDKCIDILREYTKKFVDNEKSVEAIVAHNTKGKHTSYLVKWTDKSKGETWESNKTIKKVCPKKLADYRSAEVEDILQHKLFQGVSKYLIKWKGTNIHTWESGRRTVAICPQILDKFTKKNPDCNPIIYDSTTVYVHGSDLLKTTKILEGRKNHENKEWEVKRIMNVRTKEDQSREFLIRWKGYTAKNDSWEAEEHLNCPDLINEYMVEAEKAKNALERKKRPLRKQRYSDADGKGDANGKDN